jgi:CRP-like cAMP-binding protein
MLSKNNQKDTFTLTMSYTSLAEYLCVDRSALMREIKKLKEQNVIKVNKKTITLRNDKYI